MNAEKILLTLDDPTNWDSEKGGIRDDLSAVVRTGRNLWLGCDEGASLERLTSVGQGGYAQHKRFPLGKLLNLPSDDKDALEIDIEGLDVAERYLWLVGSHSLKRKKPKNDKPVSENIDRLEDVKTDGNRFTLARIPVGEDPKTRDSVLKESAPDPKDPGKQLRAARLPGDKRRNLLIDELHADEHIGPFAPREKKSGGKKKMIGIPSKENGLDIEGLVVAGNRVFLGMRGPVLRGWAIVLELEVSDGGPGLLSLGRVGTGGRRYKKHFLDLDGLGVRELAIEGSNLLILAGPTLDLDGPVAVYRWENALQSTSDSLIWRKDLQKVLEVPYGQKGDKGRDHAEGMTVVSEPGDPTRLLIVYDSPSKKRTVDGFGVRADLFFLASGDLDKTASSAAA